MSLRIELGGEWMGRSLSMGTTMGRSLGAMDHMDVQSRENWE